MTVVAVQGRALKMPLKQRMMFLLPQCPRGSSILLLICHPWMCLTTIFYRLFPPRIQCQQTPFYRGQMCAQFQWTLHMTRLLVSKWHFLLMSHMAGLMTQNQETKRPSHPRRLRWQNKMSRAAPFIATTLTQREEILKTVST